MNKKRGRPLGIPLTPEHKAAIGAAHKGKKISDATKLLMSKAKLGRKYSDEHCDNMSKAHTGLRSESRRPISVDGIQYISIKEASDELKINYLTMFGRLKSKKFPTYIYEER